VTLLLAGSLATCSGCGNGLPPTGTAASPVKPEVAAEQNKAMQNYYDSMSKTKKAGPRR